MIQVEQPTTRTRILALAKADRRRRSTADENSTRKIDDANRGSTGSTVGFEGEVLRSLDVAAVDCAVQIHRYLSCQARTSMGLDTDEPTGTVTSKLVPCTSWPC